MSPAPKQSKAERKETARETARLMREEAQAKAKKKSLFIKLGIIVGTLVVAAIVVLVVLTVNQSSSNKEVVQPPIATEYGIMVGQGKEVIQEVPEDSAHVVIYQDYTCPGCKMFEETFAGEIDKMIEDGTAVMEYRSIGMLDHMSMGTNYSSRAANVAMCAAVEKPESFFALNSLFYKNQPAEMTEGLSNDDLKTLAGTFGITGIDDCVSDGTYRGYVKKVTDYAIEDEGIAGTPAVYINGQEWDKEGSIYEAAKEAGPAVSAKPASTEEETK